MQPRFLASLDIAWLLCRLASVPLPWALPPASIVLTRCSSSPAAFWLSWLVVEILAAVLFTLLLIAFGAMFQFDFFLKVVGKFNWHWMVQQSSARPGENYNPQFLLLPTCFPLCRTASGSSSSSSSSSSWP